MDLALKEIRHSKLRYALITAMIVLVSALVFILSGLANGLASGNSQAIDEMPANAYVVAHGSQNRFDRSSIDARTVQDVRDAAGADHAIPFSVGTLNLRQDGIEDVLGASVFGVPANSPLDPSGGKIADKNSIVADQSMLDDGVHVGDTVTVQPGNIQLKVVDSVKHRQFQLIATGYVSTETWDAIRHAQGTDAQTSSGIALIDADTARVAQIEGVDIASRSHIIRNLPGYSAQAGTFTMIQVFLLSIASGIIAAFFFIITLQKMPELGVMKALGARTSELATSLFLQILMLGIVGILIGISIGDTVALLARKKVPFELRWEEMLKYGSILLLVAVLGGLLSLLRIARVDPLDAINKVG